MKKGEIRLVEIPASNGHEQSGLHPVILLSSGEANTVIVIPFTTNMASLRFNHTIEIHPSPENGLSTISVALVFQIRAIDCKRILRKIGDLESDILKKIGEMIKEMLYI